MRLTIRSATKNVDSSLVIVFTARRLGFWLHCPVSWAWLSSPKFWAWMSVSLLRSNTPNSQRSSSFLPVSQIHACIDKGVPLNNLTLVKNAEHKIPSLVTHPQTFTETPTHASIYIYIYIYIYIRPYIYIYIYIYINARYRATCLLWKLALTILPFTLSWTLTNGSSRKICRFLKGRKEKMKVGKDKGEDKRKIKSLQMLRRMKKRKKERIVRERERKNILVPKTDFIFFMLFFADIWGNYR